MLRGRIEPYLVVAACISDVSDYVAIVDADDECLSSGNRARWGSNRERRTAADDRLVIGTEREAGARAVHHREHGGNLHAAGIDHRDTALRGIRAHLRDRDVEQTGLRRPLWLLNAVLCVHTVSFIEDDLSEDLMVVGVDQSYEGGGVGIIRGCQNVIARVPCHLVNALYLRWVGGIRNLNGIGNAERSHI